jgi:hypothetical protein
MKQLLKKYWFWFVSIVLLYSIFDYFEHILRPESVFEELWLDWLLFNIGAIGSLLLIVLGAKNLLEAVLKKQSLLFELTAIAIWIVLYLNLIGPMLNTYIWPPQDLFFQFQFSSFFVILTIYFVLRIIINLVRKKPLLG